jgi:hypothetical protein
LFNILESDDFVKRISAISPLWGLPSRTELSTALTVSTVPVPLENEEEVLTQEEIEERVREIEREKEMEELSYYYTNKKSKKVEKPKIKITAPTTGVGPTPLDPVPDSLRRSLCGNLRGTVGRLKALIPGWEGTTLHAITLLHR